MIKRFFINNWELKILALLSAIILWFFVVGIENNSYRFPEQIDIQAVNVPQDMSVSSDLGKANIRIQADQDMIKNLTANDFDLSVDLTNAHEGEQDVPLSGTSKNDKVTILKVEPATVHVVLEQITQKDIKVKAIITGNPAKGYSVQSSTVTPTTITVSGGKSLLSKISSINAQIQLEGNESTNFKQNVTLQLPPTVSSPNNIILNPQQVMVEVTIVQDLQQKTVVVKPDLQGMTDLIVLSKKLLVTPETIVIEGKGDSLNKVDSISTEPIQLDALKNSTIPVKAKLILPEGVSLSGNQGNTVMISLTAP